MKSRLGGECKRHLRSQVRKAQCLFNCEVRRKEGEKESKKLGVMVRQKWEMQEENQLDGVQ